MSEVRKSWAVILKEPSTGSINWPLEPTGVPVNQEQSPVAEYWQFIDGEGFHFEICFRNGKWIDCPSYPGTPSLNGLILQGHPNVVELIDIEPWLPEMAFGDAAKPRFSEENLVAIAKLVTEEPDRLKAAQELARLAHKGQADKADKDYFDHPRRVFENVSQIPGFSELSEQRQLDTQIGAWLHDVLEDSGENEIGQILPSDLAEWGFSADQIWICDDLNKKPTILESEKVFESYMTQIMAREESRLVKIADSADNNNLSRINAVTEARNEHFDQSSNKATRAALQLTPEENAWFEQSIAKVVA
jgi:hypothetical protein